MFKASKAAKSSVENYKESKKMRVCRAQSRCNGHKSSNTAAKDALNNPSRFPGPNVLGGEQLYFPTKQYYHL